MAIKCNINASIGTVTFTATDGASLTIHAERLHPELRAYAALHGLKQKVGDAAALGASATDADKFEAMRAIVSHLESGSDSWNLGRVGGGDSALIEALVLAGKPDTADMRAKVRAMTTAQRTALQSADVVKPHYDAIMALRGKGIDTDSLLAGI